MLTRIVHSYREAYRGQPREIWLLTLAIFINRSGTMVSPFLLLYLTTQLHLSASSAGLLLALVGAAGIVGTYLGGWLVDRASPRAVQAGSLLATGMCLYTVGQVRNLLGLGVCLFLLGLVTEIFRPANAAAVSRLSSPETKSRAFALRRLGVNLGMTFGPAIGGFLAVHNYQWLFWIDAATSLIAAGLIWSFFSDKESGARVDKEEMVGESRAARSVHQDLPYLVFLGLFILVSLLLYQALGTFVLTLREVYHLRESAIGLVLAVNTVTIITLEMLLVHRMQKFVPINVLGWGAILIGVGFGIVPLGHSFAFAALSVLVWTFGEMMTTPVAEAVVAERAPRRKVGMYMGWFATASRVAFMLAQLLGTRVYQSFGPDALWFGCGALGVLAGAAYYRLARWM